MEENPRQRKTRKGVKFLLVGILASIVFTSFVGVFMLFVPTGKAILPFPIPVPTFQVESQPALRERIWETVKDILASSAAVAYKKGLSYFLNKAAYDAAVYIGSGGEGQTPLFLVKPGKYFEEVADGAAGEFLDTIGKSVFGESLCTFTPEVELKIQVLARRTLEPAKPSCTLKDIRNNINRISKFTTEDIASFNTSFKPWGSQIGALLTLQTSAGEAALRARNQAELEQTASSFLGVKDPVTGFVKSPREAVESTLDSVLADSRQAELTYTGKPLADAFGIFTNTLVSQLYKTIFEKGLAPPTSRYTIPGAPTGVAAAKRFNTELGRPSFRTGGAVNILNELASCPDQFRDVNNCVIRDDFESAINARMTLGEALEQGVINRNKTFGFDATGQEPEPENGLPYRSIVILRKYRIVPSTWEAAALYIKNFHDSSMGIGDLVDAYDNEFNADGTPNPFYHLVDPNWVLKAPETFCRIEGPGEEIISEQFIQSDTNGDGAIDSDDEDTRIVVRRDYCADERTCISENEDGSCSFYGYCVEEKPTWRFFGSSCSPDASSCQTFVTRGDDAVSYIQNSVNYDSCSSDSVGCRWYCQEYDAGLGEFTCSSENYLASGNKINLDADATTCPGGDASCDEYVRVMPGSNLVANSGFEIYSGILDDGNGDDISAAYPHWSWINNGLFLQAVSLPYEGAVALLAEDVGGNMEYWIETGSSVVKKTFTASAYVRTDNPADCAPIAIGVGADHDGDGSFDNYVDPIAFPATSLTNSDWTRISAAATINDFPTANENRVGFQLNVPGGCDLLIDGVQLEIGDITQYAEYNSRNQFFMTDQSDNFLSNGSFSHDNGTDFYPNFNQDDYSPGNGRADGWVATVIDDTGGYTDGSAGRGGYQDIPVTLGTRYDVYGWVVTGGNTAPITTQCLDANHLPLANCNLNADGADPRTQIVGDTGSWTWVNFGVEADSADAAFIRVRLEIDGGVKYDDLGLSLSSETSVCRADEVGCELYDPAEAGDTVPGIVGADDFCSEEYAGCKSYKQMPVENGADLLLVDRSGPDPVNLIASSGEQCNAAYVGCEEFTNLDEVELGGEGLEYYTYIRQCLKPGPECATYFRWEGDDVRGFELVSESLKGGGGTQPELADGTPCDCDPSEPGCLLYYDQGGNNYYCPEKKTISCSDDCHPLRNTLDGQIYNAIPDQSVSCPSRQATCREYRGSTGYNIRRIIEETFDDGDAVGWEPAPDVTISTESLDPGGLSALVQGGNLLYTPVNELAEEGRSYVLEFWAKSVSGNVTISANFDPSGVLFAGAAELTEDRWNKYVLGPAQFDAIVDEANEVLAISGSGAFFIDNINVWETQDSVYLKYNSYDTCPLEEVGCSLYFDRAGEENYLKSFSRLCRPEKIGCEAVIETQNSTNPFATDVRGAGTIADAVRPIINDPRDYCAESSKGCSALGLPILDDEGRAVDFETVFINDNPDTYQTSVCEDSKLYCDQYQYGEGGASFSFFKDPNAQDCEFRKGVNVAGNVYDAWFKTGTDSFCPVEKYNCIGGATPGAVCFGPGDPVCGAGSCEEYQAHPQPTTVCGPQQQEFCQGGYRADATCNSLANAEDPVLGCADPDSDDDGFCSDLTEVCYGGPRTGQSCDSDANPEDASLGCADPDSDNDGYCAEQICQSANYCDNDPSVACFADSDCPTGGSCLNDECGGNLLCGEYWVGSCDETESGCSEYRDPQDPLPSLVSSGKICAGGANSGAACAADSDCDSGQCVYQGCRADCRVEYDSNGNFYRLNEDCEPFAHFSLAPDLLPGCEPYFNIQDTVDQSTCAGVVNPAEGCYLFNDTTGAEGLRFDSDFSYALADVENGSPVLCPGEYASCIADSNAVIKVTPDRTCNQWLYCKTSFTIQNQNGQEERVCFDVGNCQELGSAGQCNKPIGEGQCDNDPTRACRVDADCENGGLCVNPPDFDHPADPVYEDRLVTPAPHALDQTYQISEIDTIKNLSGYSRAGITWGCSNNPEQLCWRDGICAGGVNEGGLCQTNVDCPGSLCQDDQCPGLDAFGEPHVCEVVHGYYPPATMQEIGLGLDLPNHDFENSVPDPWEARNFTTPIPIDVIPDPDDSTGENEVLVVYPQSPLPAGAGARVSLDALVFDDQQLVVNMRMRADTEMRVLVQLCYQGDSGVENCEAAGNGQSFGTLLVTDYWQDFSLPVGSALVTSGISGTTYLVINQVDTPPDTPTVYYIDDVSLESVLEKKSTNKPDELPSDERYVRRSCRLYPEEGALTCSYIDDQQRIQRGWKGYCLEKDPRDPTLCLQWWPVDIISGESDIFGGGEIVGYFGDAPLYYCLQESLYEFRRPFVLSWPGPSGNKGNCRSAGSYKCPSDYYKAMCAKDVIGGGRADKCEQWCIPYGIDAEEVCETGNHDHGNPYQIWNDGDIVEPLAGFWTPFDGSLEKTHEYNQFGTDGINLGVASEVLGVRCDIVGQTVDPNFENKAWANRINGGYTVWDIGYGIDQDLNPYGSLVPGEQSGADNNPNNPSTWNSEYTQSWGRPFSNFICGNLDKEPRCVGYPPAEGGDHGNECTENADCQTGRCEVPCVRQPIYYLNDQYPTGINWQGPDELLHPTDYEDRARAGSPYSCKHNVRECTRGCHFEYDDGGDLQLVCGYICQDLHLCPRSFGNQYQDVEQFSGPLFDASGIPSPPSHNPNEGGLGLKRIERLFADVVKVWVWGDGVCEDVGGLRCDSPDSGYLLQDQYCVTDSECTIEDGVCAGQICVGGPNNFEPCGCPAGEICEASQVCDIGGDLCGLSVCTGPGDACVTARCEGGLDAGGVCSVVNNCPTGSTCSDSKKCIENTNPSCDCPNAGTCSPQTVCLDDPGGPICGGDADCTWYCDGSILKSACTPGDDEFCEGAYGGSSSCEPVDGMCDGSSPRCSGDLTETCSISNNCSAGYQCNSDSQCENTTVTSCDCRGDAFCADGACTGDSTIVCASNDTPVDICDDAGAGVCDSSLDICRIVDAQCSCGAGDGTCSEREICNLSGIDCGDGFCDSGVCSDKVCVGGLNDGLACTDVSNCPPDPGAPDDPLDDEIGACVEAVCAIDPDTGGCGFFCGQTCASNETCVGAQGTCEPFEGICVGGDKNGEPCADVAGDSDCPGGGNCVDKACIGGVRSGTACEVTQMCTSGANAGAACGVLGANEAECGTDEDGNAGVCEDVDPDQYCNAVTDPAFTSQNPKYYPDNDIFASAYHQDFDSMEQCRFTNGSGGGSDTRPGPSEYYEDYCWAQPSVFNIKINNKTRAISIPNGGGTAVLSFNTAVNSEQVPIKKIVIDWGDGTVQAVPFFPGIAPRSNPNGPYHYATHDYLAPDCSAASPCTVRVWVDDNWEKGSGYCSNDTALDCSSDADCGGGECRGSCRGANQFDLCLSNADCGPAPAYCSSIFPGEVVVEP